MAAPEPGAPLPVAPAEGQQPYVELQAMAVQPGQQARQIRVVQPAVGGGAAAPLQPLAPGFAPAAPPPLDAGREDREARRRVLCISMAIAAYVVLGTILQYAFDIAAFEEAISKIQSVTHMHPRGHSLASFIVNTSPQVGWSIAIGMLVPLCGYLGVKQNNEWMLGCFCSCNALHCCCGMLSVVSIVGVLMGISAAAPGVFLMLESCDPLQCVPSGHNLTDKYVVDCLATGMWEDYKPRFKHPERFPAECPKIFLMCNHGHGRPQDVMYHPLLVEGDESEAPAAGHTGFEASGVTPGWSPTTRKLSVARKVLLTGAGPTDAPDRREAMRSMFRRHHPPAAPPMPAHPLKECETAKTAMAFHEARVLAPELLPKLVLFLVVKVMLMIPVIILGCFGFCWGKEMWTRLGQGYAHLTAATPGPAPAEVPLQPITAFAAVPPSTDAQLAQPLMLNAPPLPPTLQQAAGSPQTTDQE
mmetsp:Transcript_133180/g.371251  ORF Transcript_133180/g.371251 Transcript_133180/m.371251 type:complete len:472 (-) Transcript_133180:8-1423(-)